MSKESDAKRKAARLLAGLCYQCGKSAPEPRLKRCQPCREQEMASKVRRRAALLAMGRCLECGFGITAPGAKRCGDCHEAHRDRSAARTDEERAIRARRQREHYAKAVAAGWCHDCRKRPKLTGRSRCHRCTELRRIRWQERRRRLEQEQGPLPTRRPSPQMRAKGRKAPANHPWRGRSPLQNARAAAEAAVQA